MINIVLATILGLAFDFATCHGISHQDWFIFVVINNNIENGEDDNDHDIYTRLFISSLLAATDQC